MWTSEDSADDEFVFVANKTVEVAGHDEYVWPRSSSHRPNQHHHNTSRLNQPIPTTLDLDPSPGPRMCSPPAVTTMTRAKATPLPPELIELLPPHLRENTVPDYTTSSITNTNPPRHTQSHSSYSYADYCNLDKTPSPTSAQNYDFLSELTELISWDGKTSSYDNAHAGRASSVSLTRPAARHHPNPTTASLTAPAALALTDSGISSGNSSNSGGNSSISSRSSSNRSVARERSKTPQGRQASQSPTPKFTRPPATTSFSPFTSSPTNSTNNSTNGAYSAVVSIDGAKTPLIRRHDHPSQTQAHLLHHFRAANDVLPKNQSSPCTAKSQPHSNHNSTAYTSINKNRHVSPVRYLISPESSTAGVPLSSFKPNHLFICEENSSIEARPQTGAIPQENEVELAGMVGRTITPSPSTTNTNYSNLPNNTSHPCRAGSPSNLGLRPATPPSSPELRRAWNVAGVPVVPEMQARQGSPGSSHFACGSGSHSDSDSIYDNMFIRRSVSPSHRQVAITSPCTTFQNGGVLASPTSRRVQQSPVAGRPPSPPIQCRASRSPTPTGRCASSSRPSSPQYMAYYPSQDPKQSGYWVPVWGSSPQLCQDAGNYIYPACYYSPPPPCAIMCDVRSHSCDRLPARPSPPPSPHSGRRSESPWRGGSVSPAAMRHSPSPDRTAGRPPRPRRPPHRKSKTVEVGYIGLGNPPSSQGKQHPNMIRGLSHLHAAPLTPSPQMNVMCGHSHVRHHSTPDSVVACGAPQRSTSVERDVVRSGGMAGLWYPGGSPCVTSSSAPPFTTPIPSPTPSCQSKELLNGTKQKVTYKSSIYKCMKNLLRQTQ